MNCGFVSLRSDNPYHGPSHVVDILQLGPQRSRPCQAFPPMLSSLRFLVTLLEETGLDARHTRTPTHKSEVLAFRTMHAHTLSVIEDRTLSPESRAALFLAGAAHVPGLHRHCDLVTLLR